MNNYPVTINMIRANIMEFLSTKNYSLEEIIKLATMPDRFLIAVAINEGWVPKEEFVPIVNQIRKENFEVTKKKIQLGKYHRSACISQPTNYDLSQYRRRDIFRGAANDIALRYRDELVAVHFNGVYSVKPDIIYFCTGWDNDGQCWDHYLYGRDIGAEMIFQDGIAPLKSPTEDFDDDEFDIYKHTPSGKITRATKVNIAGLPLTEGRKYYVNFPEKDRDGDWALLTEEEFERDFVKIEGDASFPSGKRFSIYET